MSEHYIHDKYSILTCPFDESHRIDAYRFQRHLIKCAKNHPDMDMVWCPFNHTHVVPRVEKQHHMSTCPDRQAVVRDAVNDMCSDGDNGEYFHGDLSVPDYDTNPWDRAKPCEDWDDESNPYKPKFSLLEAEAGAMGEPAALSSRESQIDREPRLPRHVPQAASRVQHQQDVFPTPGFPGPPGRGRGRPPLTHTQPGLSERNGRHTGQVGYQEQFRGYDQLSAPIGIGRGIGRGVQLETPTGRGSSQSACANVPNFSPMGRGRACAPCNGVAASGDYPSLAAASNVPRGRGTILNSQARGTSPIGATSTNTHPVTGNIPQGVRRANASNFSLKKPSGPALGTAEGQYSVSATIGNSGIGRGTTAPAPAFIVPNVNRSQSATPPAGDRRNGNNNSSHDRDTYTGPSGSVSSAGMYGTYGGGYRALSSTPSVTDSASSTSASLQDFDTEDDEETKQQKEIRKLEKKLRDIEVLEKKRKQNKPLNRDQEEKLAKKAEIEDLLNSLRIN